ncbi:MAG TPA: aminoglycoside phosphotransferase family protein [Thermoanaerobaculia bacterium]|nr:aminoglycoside phosphotransferase family protein [Thermoanaerobaculia bacterium]
MRQLVRRVELPDGTPAVLKLTRTAAQEAAALRAFDGRGSVRLLAENSGALLLERAEPGYDLSRLAAVDDRQATSIAASVARKLWREAPAGFPSVETWEADLARDEDASAVFRELVGSMPQTFFLHGDLHHLNILASGDEWLAIDPKGIVGERACEIGPLVLNPVGLLDLAAILNRRIDQLSEELDLDRERARAWTFVRAVLAISWAREDRSEVPPVWLTIATLLRQSV